MWEGPRPTPHSDGSTGWPPGLPPALERILRNPLSESLKTAGATLFICLYYDVLHTICQSEQLSPRHITEKKNVTSLILLLNSNAHKVLFYSNQPCKMHESSLIS